MKSIKFVSKQSNYRVMLVHGLQAEPLTGRSAIPGVSVKFEDGIANVDNEEIVDMMMKHPAYGKDYIVSDADEDLLKEFVGSRKDSEPIHNIQEMEYGHMGKNINPKSPVPLTADKEQALRETAERMAKEMAIPMAKEIAMEMIREMSKAKNKDTGKTSDSNPDEEVKDSGTTGERSGVQFTCEECGKAFDSKMALAGHKRVHNK